MARFQIEAAVTTDVGRVRTNNEDNFYLCGAIRQDTAANSARAGCTAAARGFLAAVCDGMGGEENGERASLLAVQNLKKSSFDQIRPTALACIQAANTQICDEMEQNGGLRMGSTLAALYIDQNKAQGCTLGDSRLYLWRDGRLRQLSVDHNKAARMVQLGVLTPEQAARHPSRHQLTQHLGIRPEEFVLEPAFTDPIPLQQGDCFLVCSDGLTDMVEDADIAACLAGGKNAAQTAEELQSLALHNGGRDNVTVLVARVQQKQSLWQWLMGGTAAEE